MTDYIIIAIVIATIAAGIFFTVKHFQGQSSCCGGGSYKPRKKKLKNILYTKTFSVSGMHCDHCKRRVEEVVNDMQGISGRVDLKKGLLTVSYAKDVADETVCERIEKAGYNVSRVV